MILIMVSSTPNPNTAVKAKRGAMRTHPAPALPRLVISVTQAIIDAGERASSRHCMLSEAVTAAVPYAVNVDSDLATIRFSDWDRGLRYVYETPVYVREAIYAFDRGEHVPPFSFHLRRGWVVAAHKRDDVSARMPLASWLALKSEVKAARQKRGVSWKTVAAETGMRVTTLKTYLTRGAHLPGASVARKIEAWVSTNTGQKAAPHVHSRAASVRGPAQFRRDVTGKALPQIVGGRAPPVGSRFRQFGLRAFVRQPRPVTVEGER
jgi:hypothetical protein